MIDLDWLRDVLNAARVKALLQRDAPSIDGARSLVNLLEAALQIIKKPKEDTCKTETKLND